MTTYQHENPLNEPEDSKNEQDHEKNRVAMLSQVADHMQLHTRGLFLIGEPVSASKTHWLGYKLLPNEADSLALAVILPQLIPSWVRNVLQDNIALDYLSCDVSRGNTTDSENFSRATDASVAALSEFFERWVLIGNFVSDLQRTASIVHAHKAESDSTLSFIREAVVAMDGVWANFMALFGYHSELSIMKQTHEVVRDLVQLYPELDSSMDMLYPLEAQAPKRVEQLFRGDMAEETSKLLDHLFDISGSSDSGPTLGDSFENILPPEDN